ncbi:ABC transporter substrate-binding protein [Schumannella sp. 10F1B-5-1]|uniref:ABC transporter substrate-binding protein n=1 Tax=Schumannella sp. 10F1B-5-1 TaxID=2590780 RepID=UPI001131E787|nr:ABC transporter substrate-binding protein [Schumannella sp. 10F1B-5-1]TPW70198.1 ABC transporter substrate-binding protein [Schumannella sp. 10F1B-5-1]
MFTARKKGRLTALAAVAVGAALALAGCGSSDPLSSGSGGDSDEIVIGSQAYYSNEIIAEIYAQALEADGQKVKRQFNIGQRDAYMPSLESGELDLFPEYTGNLLQYYDKDATETKPDEVFAALQKALPKNLEALQYSPATDQDSYNVTADYAKANNLTSIADLANVSDVKLGGAPELEKRPYGPEGLKSVYNVTVSFQPTGDTTVDALVAGTVDVADIYSADPSIKSKNLVTLEDPDGLFLSSNVVPIVNADKADAIKKVIDPISAKLTAEGLVALNVESVDDKKSSADIAKKWLTDNGFLK